MRLCLVEASRERKKERKKKGRESGEKTPPSGGWKCEMCLAAESRDLILPLCTQEGLLSSSSPPLPGWAESLGRAAGLSVLALLIP